MKDLNFKSFQYAIEECIKEDVEFVLVAGDLFDSPYPPIDTLKDTFKEFRKLKEANIPVFLIAGSHDFSASGKTFLDVLEKAGFCKNVSIFEEKDGKIILQPTIYKGAAIYGYPGKKAGMEVDEVERIKLQDSPGFYRILMLHTSLRGAICNLPIKTVNEDNIPKVDYCALGHLHIKYQKGNIVYSGPTFPNSISELEDLKGGSFFIINNGLFKRKEIKLKDILIFNFEIRNALNATEEILSTLKKEMLKDKVIILRLYGILEVGKSSDIDFTKIESYLKNEGAYVMLKSTAKLQLSGQEVKIDYLDSTALETEIIKKFEETNPNKFNELIPSLVKILQIEKMEDERLSVFEERLISETRRVLPL